MADYYAKIRTNYFSVTNPEKFREIMAKCRGEDVVKVFDQTQADGSGINFKRKRLNDILERAMCGEQLEVVVVYKDRLARFGYDLIERVKWRD